MSKVRLTKDEYQACAATAAAVTGYDSANSPIRGAKTMAILQTTITDIENGNTAIALDTLKQLQLREAFNAIRGDQVKSAIKAKEQAAP